MSSDASTVLAQLTAALEREPFAAFRIETADGRSVAVKERDRAVLNSLAISVVEEAFSVTVIGLDSVRRVVDVH